MNARTDRPGKTAKDAKAAEIKAANRRARKASKVNCRDY